MLRLVSKRNGTFFTECVIGDVILQPQVTHVADT